MISLIPQPKIIKENNGTKLKLDKSYKIKLAMETSDTRINRIVQATFKEYNRQIEFSDSDEGFFLLINFKGSFDKREYMSKAGEHKEGYLLEIKPDSVVVYSKFVEGMFQGIQTLIQLMENYEEIPTMKIIDWPDLAIRGMNFDFRQIVPRFENILEYIRQFAKWKVNTLLIEYEDKLPFKKHGSLKNKEYAFSEEQLEKIKETAWDNFIEIIPLQQTFGHLEYVLKHDEYKHLRETAKDIGELCPLKSQSYEIAVELLEEMMQFHPESQYVHIGCDEVWSLCTCEECVRTYDDNRGKAFVDYVNKLIAFVYDRGKTPIIWHDMLDKCMDNDLEKLDKRVVVMVWIYRQFGLENVLNETVGRLHKMGIRVIGASAVRCHDNKSDQNLPITHNRIENISQWITKAEKFNINSIISTNWATAFAMGSPYGIFENSLYLSAFSAEKYWNKNADSGSFMLRYLKIYHGVAVDELEPWIRERTPEDYYWTLEYIIPHIKKNIRIAQLLILLGKLDHLMNVFQDTYKYTFRYFMYRENEAERTALECRYRKAIEGLQTIRPKLEGKLAEFLSDGMICLFINSRYMMIDYLKENLYDSLFLS